METFLEELKRIIFVLILLVIVFISVTSCATTIKQVPVLVKPNITIITCPDIPMASESSILYDIVDLHKNYQICKHQIDILKEILE